MKKRALQQLKERCIKELQDFLSPGELIVFGEGNPKAKIMLIGEAPGEQEAKSGRPFVGQAGKNLDEFLQAVGLEREELYISNVVKFRPYRINPKSGRKNNRAPNKEEIKLCRPFLEEEVELLRPRLIVTLGNVPLRVMTKEEGLKIGDCHGKPMQLREDVYLFPLYHPASVIYRQELKETYRQDLQRLREFLKQEGIG